MSIAMNYIGLGLAAAVVVGIFWWILSLSTKSPAQRRQVPAATRTGSQPWGDDKAGGRGIR